MTNTILSRFSGALSSRFGAMPMLVAGFLICAAASALFAFSYTAAMLFAVQALYGVGMGLILPVTVAGAIRNIDPEMRGAAMGFYQSVYGAGMFLGPVLAGGIVQTAGYRVNFFAMAGILAMGAALSLLWRLTANRSS
jgi:MFS family permease